MPWIQGESYSQLSISEIISSLYSADLLAPAQYWQDPWRGEDFKKYSKYLAIVNNQRDAKNPRLKENLLKLDNFVLVAWENDTFIKPKVTLIWS